MNWGKIAIGLRVGQGALPVFEQSWNALLAHGMLTGDQLLQSTAGLAHHYAAEALAKQFLGSAADSILFVDDDMVFPVYALRRLREDPKGAGFGIMQAMCQSSQPPYGPQVGSPRPEMNTVEEVPFCGLAFTLVRRKVIEDIVAAKPKAEMVFTWGQTGEAEDVGFSKKATALGHKCGMNTSMRIGHILKNVVVEWDVAKQKPILKTYAYNGSSTLREWSCDFAT